MMQTRLRSIAIAALGVAVVSSLPGCGPGTMYDWGSYESSVAHLYSPDPKAAAAKDRVKLIEEVRKTLEHNKKVPPGKYAQIGYLCYLDGDTAAARQYFEQERDAYPESTKFMNSLIGRLR